MEGPMSFKFAEDIPSAVTREEAQCICDLGRGKRVLEVGSHFGRSTVALASVAEIVHAVDWHRGDMHAGSAETLHKFLENMIRYGVRDKVVVHLGRIENVLPILKPQSFDMVFLDAQHDKASVDRDSKLVLPLVVKGGPIAFHDYGRREFQVTEVVNAFCNVNGFRKVGVGHVMVVWTK